LSVDAPVADYSRAIGMTTSKLRVGVARVPFFDGLNPEVAKAVEAAFDVVRKLTASVVDVQVPSSGNIADVWNPEIYAYHQPWITKTPELYQEATRNLIQGAGKANAITYAQARHQLDVVRTEIKKVFASVDVIITPTQRGIAQPITPPAAPAESSGASRWRSDQHRGVRRLRPADDLRAVRILSLGSTDRSADQRQPLRRIDRADAGARLRAGD
jgi:aspartyl-tRNA(Asn)/glutamyl-tRNA(Gln) amidotransferase subunit A